MKAENGTRVVLTRERDRNGPWAERLRRVGLSVLELPLVRYETLPPPADLDLSDFSWILFTSPQGVRAFFAAGLAPGSTRLACLGDGTAAELSAAGGRDELGFHTQDGADFVRRFLAAVPEPGRVLLPGPERRQLEPLAILAERGIDTRPLPLYRTHPVSPDSLPVDPFAAGDLIFLCSPSTVRAFVAAYEARPRCVAIGETTARAAREAGFEPAVAATPDLDAMVLAAGLDPLTSPNATESGS